MHKLWKLEKHCHLKGFLQRLKTQSTCRDLAGLSKLLRNPGSMIACCIYSACPDSNTHIPQFKINLVLTFSLVQLSHLSYIPLLLLPCRSKLCGHHDSASYLLCFLLHAKLCICRIMIAMSRFPLILAHTLNSTESFRKGIYVRYEKTQYDVPKLQKETATWAGKNSALMALWSGVNTLAVGTVNLKPRQMS